MILCDLDGVLAVGPRRDTERGAPIYRTFKEPPEELLAIQDAGIPLHIVTAKVEAEAKQVLDAIGLSAGWDSVIGADRLFWPTVRAALRERRVPSALLKSTFRKAIPTQGERPIVMIEDQADNLREMLSASAIDFGILVPRFSISENRIEAGFDLNRALELARRLSEGRGFLDALETLRSSAADQEREKGITGSDRELERFPDPHGSVFQIPAWDRALPSLSLDAFDTGHALTAHRGNIVTMVRYARRISRRLMG